MINQLVNAAETRIPKAFSGKKESARSYWTIWDIGAGVGLLGGTFILAFASFLAGFQYFYGEEPHGVWLYLVVLPLWILGAHCLDKADEIEKARRIEYCRQHGVTD